MFLRGIIVCRITLFVIILLTRFAFADILYQDDFEDGNYTTADGPDGLSWELVAGNASVSSSDGSKRLGVYRGNSLIVTTQAISTGEFTYQVDIRNTWREPGRLVFLYVDPDNYYSLGIAGDPGIFRMMNGVEDKLFTDPGLIRLPHASRSSATFKVYANNNGNTITIQVDKGGDGVDYDAEIVDTTAEAVTRFVHTKAGQMTSGTNVNSPWFYIDNVKIHDERVLDRRAPATYYVDAANGDDSHTAQEAQNEATPWQTIQKAAEVLLSGDVAKVKPGVYRETVTPAHSGGKGAPLTFQAYNLQDKPVLDGSDIVSLSDWTHVDITDFRGNVQSVHKTTIDWLPSAVYQNNVRMFAAQHPNQTDASDPYDINAFILVPAACNDGSSNTELIDPSFFTQSQAGYWKTASLLLYDRHSNGITERAVTGYVPSENKLTTEAFSQWIWFDEDDKYALRHHLGILDQAGEYYVDTTVNPYEIYVWSYPGEDLSAIAAGRRDHAVDLSLGNRNHIVIDGFEIRFTTGHGVNVRNNSNHFTIRNCDIHHTMVDGIASRFTEGIHIENCKIHHNRNTGIGLSNGADYCISNCDVYRNGNNGIWFGAGGGDIFNTVNCTVKDSYIHHQGGRRSHADNFQMHQCQHVYLLGNLFVQEGRQNMWTAHSDDYVIANNIYMCGALGINATKRSRLYNNVFYESTLRYDAHIPDDDNYKPASARISNNIIINSGISYPPSNLVDRFDVFTLDHNYYNMNSVAAWDWGGYHCGVDRGNSMLVTAQVMPSDEYTIEVDIRNTWSEPGKLLVAYQDQDNYYAIGIGGQRGIFRVLNGVEELVRDDTANAIRLPHASPVNGSFRFYVNNNGSDITIKAARDPIDTEYQLGVTDNSAEAVARFTGNKIGMMTTGDNASSPWFFIDNVILQAGATTHQDDFEDGDYTANDSTNGLTWEIVRGEASVNATSGSGVGIGEGSIWHSDYDSLGSLIVQPPDANDENYDFHLLETSILRDAGRDHEVPYDREDNPRPQGPGFDIGPYEYEVDFMQQPGIKIENPLSDFILYPNPGNALMKINFSVPSPGSTSLYICDVTGREIKRLVEDKTLEGEQSTSWDGTDASGARVSPGLFYCRLETDNRIFVKRLMVIN